MVVSSSDISCEVCQSSLKRQNSLFAWADGSDATDWQYGLQDHRGQGETGGRQTTLVQQCCHGERRLQWIMDGAVV